jgi:NDP-sugar pyrophosphorylase family protein
MKAMIFAAGLGTRFKPWTDHHPKALAIVNGRSLLQRNIEYLQKFNITDVVVNVHHFREQIITTIEENKGWGSNIIISDEKDEVLETGGGLIKAKDLLRSSEQFFTLNVDILSNLDLNELITFHQKKDALISLCIAERETSRFLLFNEENRLCGWRNVKGNEKVEKIVLPDENLNQKAYSGIAIFKTEVLDLIPFSGKFSLIDVYLHLTKDKLITGFDHTGDKWVDVGRPESVQVAEELFK